MTSLAAPGGLPAAGREELRRLLVPDIVTRWRDAVHRDVAAEPFTGAEDAVRRGDDATIPYGTTLLVAIGTAERLLLAQIGDGDIVCIRPDGTALMAVPGDPLLDGRHTTSLCSVGAGDSFRVAAVDLTGTAVLGALLATDGYGNAQVAQVWESVVSAELAGLITTRPGVLDGQPAAGAGGPVRLGGRQCRRHHHSRCCSPPPPRRHGPAAPVPPAGRMIRQSVAGTARQCGRPGRHER